MLLPADAQRLVAQASTTPVLPSETASAEATAMAERLCRN
jgi:hypothetical protein